MKKYFISVSLVFGLTVAMLNLNAQVAPLREGLKHLWDFEYYLPLDVVGQAHGAFDPGALAFIFDGKLNLTQGGFVSFPADTIAINTYQAVSIETWATPSTSANAPNPNMLWSFGRAGNPGLYYFFFTPARWGTGVAARISVGPTQPWLHEAGLAFSAPIADSTLQHYVLTFDASRTMRLYVNGVLLTYGDPPTQAVATLPETHVLDSIATDDAFLGAAVYPDPTWRGTIDLHAIWNVALSADEVRWLFERGANRLISDIPTTIKPVNKPSPVVKVIDNRLFMRNLPESFTNVSVTIYNIKGSVVYRDQDAQNGDYLNLKAGVYIVKVEGQGSRFVNKVIIVE